MIKNCRKSLTYILSIIFVLSCMSLVGTITVFAGSLSEQEFASKISNLKTIYRDGEYWNAYNDCGYDGTGTKKCSCSTSCSGSCPDKCGKFYLNGTYYGGQCYGFANKMGYLVFGSVPTASWTKYTSVSEYYAGDYVRVRSDHHSIFITKVSGNTITYVDCNNAGPCMVKWDRTISVSSLKSITTYVYHYSGNSLKGTGTPNPPNPDPDPIIWTKDTSYPTPFKAYPNNGSSKTTVYNNNLVAYNQNTRYISPGDLCTIEEVYTNGYCYVTYPTSSGTHSEFAKTSDFIPNGVGRYSYKPSQNLTTYTRSNLSTTFGSVFTTDNCTVVGKSGNLLQIIYPISNGYKLGWINPPAAIPASEFPTPLYAYNASPSERTTVYESLSTMGTYYGQIFVDDKCTLNSVSISGGWINVTYPAGNSTKTGYVYLDQFIPSGSRLTNFYTASVSQQTTTYRKNDMSVSYGYVSVGDTITVVGKNGNKLQVLYPLDTGGYKLAWIYDTYINKTLKEIYISSNPSKTSYLEGESFNSSGLVINARYTDGSTSNVTGSCSLSGYNSTPGSKTITASYNGKTTAFTVSVSAKSLTGISITSNPTKTYYYEKETVSLSGLKVKASFNNGTSNEVSDYYVDTNNVTNSTGTKTLTVMYTYNNSVTKSATFSITVSHKIGDWTITKNATCTETGTKVKKCSICGYVSETQTIAATGHSYTTKVVAPTCTAQGYTLHTCSKCSNSYKDTYTNATGHNYGSWTTTKQATCTEKGSKTRKCQTCGNTETSEIAATGHSYTTKVVAPTCTAQGYTLHTCSKCNNSYKDTYTNATGHNYGSWTTTKEATCTEKGSKTRKCQTCGNTETSEIAATGHSYTTKVVAPTCTAQGYTLHTCSKCNDTFKDTYTNATGHNYTTKIVSPTPTIQGYTLHTCSVCGDNYKDNYTDYNNPNPPQIIVENKTVTAGEEFEVNISLNNNPGITGFKFYIQYNNSVLTLVDAESIGINALYSQRISDNPYVASWESGDHDIYNNGNLIKLKFIAKESSMAGDYPITISYDEDDIYNLKEENIYFEVVNGVITIQKNLSGNVAAESISLNKSSVDLSVGDIEIITATINPANTTDKNVTWLSTDTSVATVNEGVIKAVGNGQTVIVAKTTNGITAYVSVNVKTISVLSNNSTISSTSIDLGNKVTLNAKASGGKAPYTYAMMYKLSTSSTWKVIGTKYSTESVGQFTPVSEGTYDVLVSVKDKTGTTAAKKFSVAVTSELVNKSTVSAEKITKGKSVTVNASAEGGSAPYTYAMMYKLSTSSSWKVIGTKYSTESVGQFTPVSEGTYDVLVSVKDKAGTTAAKKFSVAVTSELVNKSTVSAEKITKGKSVTVNASAEGGSAPYTYAMMYKLSTSSSWKVIGTKYGTESVGSFTPASVGTYEILISVKDSTGKTEAKKFSLTVKDNKLANKSYVSGTDVPCGTKITITGAAEGGEGAYLYTYQIKKPGKTSWTTLGEKYGTDTSKVFTTKLSGTYEVRVLVKDGAGTVKSFTAKVNSTGTLLINKSFLSTTSEVGDKVTLTAVAKGGTAPYRYTYEYKKPGETKFKTIGKRGATYKSVTLDMETAGTYEARVYIQDASDYVTVKTFKITVS